jgi:non-lysosomal glucosylceramidase
MNTIPSGPNRNRTDCPSADCGCHGFDRREFLRLSTLAAAGWLSTPMPVMAGPFEISEFEKLVPADKKLDPDWVKSLFERGERRVSRGADLDKIGMPVGGICSGQLYLGGDGKLWHWDIFNQVKNTGDGHYANPPQPASPLNQGFALRIHSAGGDQTRTLDREGWREIEFVGEYPIGQVEYRDADSPVRVSLEAFSPFIPLNTEDSALPATVMRFTVRNPSREKARCELTGWLENAVCLYSAQPGLGRRRNRIALRRGHAFLECGAELIPAAVRKVKRDDILFDDFEKAAYEGWKATGTAFGDGPMTRDKMPAYQGEIGSHGPGLVNTHNARHGENVNEADAHTGTLTSREFTIERDYLNYLIGGGNHPGKTCVNLVIDGRVIASATGKDSNLMAPGCFDVRAWQGRQARLQIVDQESGAWGNIGVDDIVFSDEPRSARWALGQQPDFGTMGLALLGTGDDFFNADAASAAIPAGAFPTVATTVKEAKLPFGQKLTGALGRAFTLKPGQEVTITFVITWHFPNIRLGGLPEVGGRWYGARFANALAVADYVSANFDRLRRDTVLWRDTWLDSSLPHWFLDRTFLNTSILATNTCYWFGNGRFYAWEGVGCCEGTCTHVWHYAHAVARLFPLLERRLRERTDFGAGFDEPTGRIRFRAEHNDHWAVDGQSGCILRTYREHRMSVNSEFLKPLWPKVKKALEFLIQKDTGEDGIIDGPQHNTLDADWWGKVAWLSSLYLAALRAGEEMANEMGDSDFAARCRAIFEKGRPAVSEQLFNGEYFIQQKDPAHDKTVGSYDGCEIDQVFGPSWACQVGLGDILAPDKVRTALRSLWQYNFTPDVGPYRKAYKPGRWYAMAGEAGLLMCTWPKGETQRIKESFDFYFNECMTGFEYQVAWHMIASGMVMEGLAITRAIHDRYHPSRRNPWNEVECGDHYARAMASYGVFLTACGYDYHGPQGRLAFAPKLHPEKFQAAFTTAEGWGSYRQAINARGEFTATVALKWGKLALRTLQIEPPPGFHPGKIELTDLAAQGACGLENQRLVARFPDGLTLQAGQAASLRCQPAI